jgi:DNA-binding response OmpR family regulator
VARFDDGTLHIDSDQRQVTIDGKPVDLTSTLYELLTTLVRHQGQVLSSEELVELTWSESNVLTPPRLRVLVELLRVKLGWDHLGDDSSPLETVQGRGYRWRSVA